MSYTCLPTLQTLDRDYFEYPGQPLVLAACILQAFHSPEEAASKNTRGDSQAEASSLIPGAGGQPSKALEALLRLRAHQDAARALRELHEGWRRTVGSDNFPEAFQPGQEKAERLEPALCAVLQQLLGKGA